MKTFLVPTDFSKNAGKALDYAIALAKKEKAKIILLHAYYSTLITPEVPPQYISEQMASEQKETIERLLPLYKKVKKAGLKCDSYCRQGFIVDTILDTAKSKKADWIIMGTQGAGKLKRLLMGSNTAAVIEEAECPVIAIPEGSSYRKLKNIIYATDYRAGDASALKSLAKIARMFKANINVVHISDGEYIREGEQSLLDSYVKTVGKKAGSRNISYHLIYGKNVNKKLESYVQQQSADLLAMSTHHRNIFDRIFGKSSTRKMSYHTKVPLLAFHYKKDPIIFT